MKRYSKIRRDIPDGDVLLFEGTSLWSELIKLWTRSRFTHAGLTAYWGERLMVVESVERIGVRAIPLSQKVLEYKGKIHWYQVVDPNYSRSLAIEWAVRQMGSPYSWKQIVGFGSGLRHDIDATRFVCSELVGRALRAGGIKLSSIVPTPGDLPQVQGLMYRGVL